MGAGLERELPGRGAGVSDEGIQARQLMSASDGQLTFGRDINWTQKNSRVNIAIKAIAMH